MSTGADRGAEILDCLIRGGEKAVADFAEISGGDWFDEAPEYFLTTYLASSVRKLEKTYALLEVNVDETRQEAGARRRGRPAKNERRNGRFDFVIYGANDKPRGSIEVKSPLWVVDENRLGPDFERLVTSISANRDSSFQFGAFIYYASVSDPKAKHNNATAKLRELVTKIHDRAKGAAKEHGLVATSCPGSIHRGNEDDDGAWCVSAIVFTQKGGERYFRN
ncbi:MAG: hypothetical protein K9K30_01390 [Burkholderiaceae bacterium]|nr:hypothetical protein [Sulfuritalea sp.]MCF8173882.1 hypothetical protein [Burkholderiaceae bacterium]MCF8184550.1 hypothetical protein [Polynucleobacter sp.]